MITADCVEEVWDKTQWHHYRCSNRAKYGKYCGIHDPKRKAARKAKRGPTQFEREIVNIDAKRKRRAKLINDFEALNDTLDRLIERLRLELDQ